MTPNTPINFMRRFQRLEGRLNVDVLWRVFWLNAQTTCFALKLEHCFFRALEPVTGEATAVATGMSSTATAITRTTTKGLAVTLRAESKTNQADRLPVC